MQILRITIMYIKKIVKFIQNDRHCLEIGAIESESELVERVTGNLSHHDIDRAARVRGICVRIGWSYIIQESCTVNVRVVILTHVQALASLASVNYPTCTDGLYTTNRENEKRNLFSHCLISFFNQIFETGYR